MINAELHGLVHARPKFYDQQGGCGPWVTIELYDDEGGSVSVILERPDQATILATAGQTAAVLLEARAEVTAEVTQP